MRLLNRGCHRVPVEFQDNCDNTQQYPACLSVPDLTSGNAPDPEPRWVVQVRLSVFQNVHLFLQVYLTSPVKPGCSDG